MPPRVLALWGQNPAGQLNVQFGCPKHRHFKFFKLMQTKSGTKFRKEILSSKIFSNISNNDIKMIKKMSSDKIIKSSKSKQNKRDEEINMT